MEKQRNLKTILLVLCAAVLCIHSASAQVVELEDLNSSVIIDTESDFGIRDWHVDCATDNLWRQWFWYRIGDTAEASIDTIADPLVNVSDNDWDPGNETVNLRYSNDRLQIDLGMILTGGTYGSGVSDLTEAIAVTNLSDVAMDFHFFQYVDFDLGGPGNDYLELVNANTFKQWDESGSNWVSETVIVPAANYHEAAYWSVILSKLNDGDADILNDNDFASGDVEWAFQWDFVLAPGDTYIISKDKHLSVIPEPATMVLLGLGSLVAIRRRRSK